MYAKVYVVRVPAYRASRAEIRDEQQTVMLSPIIASGSWQPLEPSSGRGPAKRKNVAAIYRGFRCDGATVRSDDPDRMIVGGL